jgi:hypothetical protein
MVNWCDTCRLWKFGLRALVLELARSLATPNIGESGLSDDIDNVHDLLREDHGEAVIR